jgi:serine/threonine-protein kinase
VAFIANTRIYVRQMDQLEAQPVRGTDVDPLDLAFSPDGRSIAFFHGTAAMAGTGPLTDAELSRIDVTGGRPVPLTSTGSPFGIRWQGGRIVFSDGRRILAVAEAGGASETLVPATEGGRERLSQPQLVQDGRAIVYTVTDGSTFADSQIVVQSLPGGERKVLVSAGADGRVLPTGHLIWLRDSTIFGQAFDSESLQLTGSPVALVEGVRWAEFSGAGQFDVSASGTLVFVPGGESSGSELVWVDRTGRTEPVGAPRQSYTYPRVSPDGRLIAAGSDDDLWIWDVNRRTPTKLTAGPDLETYPVWMPDSQHVVFRSGPGGGQVDVYRRAADGTGTQERLTSTLEAEAPQMVLSDGRRLLMRVAATDSAPGGRLMLVGLAPDATPMPVFPSQPAAITSAEISPDGRWIAYQSPEGSTRDEVQVRPFPDVDSGRWQISSGGGTRPMWSRSARDLELFYMVTGVPARLMRVPVQPPRGGAFTYDTPETLFELANIRAGATGRAFDISPDNRRFLMVAAASDDGEQDRRVLTVVLNWTDEVRVRAPIRR